MKSNFLSNIFTFFNTEKTSQHRIKEKISYAAFGKNVDDKKQMLRTFIKEGGYGVRFINNKFFLEKNDYLIDESIFMPWIEKRFPELNNKKIK